MEIVEDAMVKGEKYIDQNKEVTLICDADEVISYAVACNGATIIRDICVKNNSDKDLERLKVKISSDSAVIEDREFIIEQLKSGEERHFKELNLNINVGYLATLTEKLTSMVSIKIYNKETELASYSCKVTVLAFDQWPGLRYTPELLVSFVMPNHPQVTSLIQLAANYLKQWTNDPSLAGYQFDDPNRVKNMAAAAYAAIQQKNIIYAEPPSSFETFGQRIRLPEAILEQHIGTCMDMTLLYVACLEAMGLNPIMVMMDGHIFAGVWLIEESFSDLFMDDPSQIEKRMSQGINELVVVECTAMCAGKNTEFDEAVKTAKQEVEDYANFEFVIDVKRARSMGIRPLPVCVKTEKGFEVLHEERNADEITQASKNDIEVFDLSNDTRIEKVTRLTQWERKLLDLSLRNMLINMRLTKALVPLLSSDVSMLEDALADGEEFQVKARPKEMVPRGEKEIPLEALGALGPFNDFVVLESKHKKLYSAYTEGELSKCLTNIYRSAKASMEENGASTLYLALGMLRWFENKKDAEGRYAPIILIPIDIIRKSASQGYSMRMRDEDTQINVTLLEFLKQMYGIQIPGLNPPPQDEHGLDVPKIFAIIRHAVMDNKMWDVIEVGVIGNFSFSQFVMWNDIHNNKEFLENSKIVNGLMRGMVEWDNNNFDEIQTKDVYLPVTVDSSQLNAINMANADMSFVLHGPPGTGKSQTITAMIANALMNGKKVLFVAEKMAALEVVQRRLSKLGIEEFCLELHSNKSTKKAVLDQLKRGLELTLDDNKSGYGEKINDVKKIKRELDAYVKALHEPRPFGKSVRQLIDVYETVPEYDKDVVFDHNFAVNLTEMDLEHQVQSLEKLVAAGKEIGDLNNYPLKEVHQIEYSQKIKFSLPQMVNEYKDLLMKLESSMKDFCDLLKIDCPVLGVEWKKLLEFANEINFLKELPSVIRTACDIDEQFYLAEQFTSKKEAFDVKKRNMLNCWKESFLSVNISTYREKYEQAKKKFFGKAKAIDAVVTEMQAFALFPIVPDDILVYLTEISTYQLEVEKMNRAEQELQYTTAEIVKKYETKECLQENKNIIKNKLNKFSNVISRVNELDTEGKLDFLIEQGEALLKQRDTFLNSEMELKQLLNMSFNTETEPIVKYKLQLCNKLLINSESLKEWIIYKQFSQECRQKGLAPICDAYENGLSHDEVLPVYYRSIYKAIILSVIENEPILNSFSGISFNEKINQFKKMDKECMELTEKYLYYKLAENTPVDWESAEISRELHVLRRAISSNGRGFSVRSLFDQIPQILPRLCPCMLMSPISVSQYIKMENDIFDLVIFDEASQIPTCKAVGVLARAKNAVIVGDPNQMPPTSFFAGNKIDEDNLEIEDLDSVLDDCLALGIPSSHLQWHYRSRHESLIAFSNKEFYENTMFTFPSVNDREKKVRLIPINGVFERGKARVNREEAKAIVEEIKRRYHDSELKEQTIGVVTFNITQQTLIEDLLQKECSNDSKFDKWMNNRNEALFVKNLENVQGDERDVILFSIAYGPDEEGKISMNFGPINREGGWKRLNVAASRARDEMLIFASLGADQINLKRTRARGVEALKSFLEYAKNGGEMEYNSSTKVSNKEGILRQICKCLDNQGYEYQRNVGHSKFKVDVGVINPFHKEEYLLGIVLDGESYRQAANTRDREIAHTSILQGLGWELHRIWTMDWWDNKQKELDKLSNSLKKKKETAYQKFVNQKKETTVSIKNNQSYTAEDKDSIKISEEKDNSKEILESYEKRKVDNSIDLQEKMPQLEKVYIENQKIAGNINININPDIDFSQNQSCNINKLKVYQLEEYSFAQPEIMDISTADYVKEENLKNIISKMQEIVKVEAPISYERLLKKTLRAFNIARSSAQTIEATEKAVEKIDAKTNKQSGTKFYWRMDQDIDSYTIYRKDAALQEKRTGDEICREELKNAVCITLYNKGPLGKEELIKETIYTMGYARSGATLVAAVERGIKYGQKTDEIFINAEGSFELNNKN